MERHLTVRDGTEMQESAGAVLRLTVLGSADLVGPNTTELRTALVQPKRLALLAYLTLASPRGFHRRDTLTALFWPESDDVRARHALRQAIHTLRRATGPDVIVSHGDSDIGINRASFWCDAIAFQEAIDAGDPEKALTLYRGDLLPGFFVSNSSAEFDHWLGAERARLKARAAAAAWALAETAEARDDGITAAAWARRALALSPDDESALRRLVALLDRFGDRAGALRAHDDFSRGLAEEFEAEPSAETKALMDSVRARQSPRNERMSSREVTPTSTARVDSSEPNQPRPRRTIRRTIAIGSVAAAAIVLVAMGYTKVRERATAASGSRPVVAVGTITERGALPGDTLSSAGTISELLATDLARVSGLHVVSHSRLYQILGQLGKREATPADVSAAAERAGATELLEGVLYRRAGAAGVLRLDLRRIDLATGVVSRAYSAEGTDLFSLVDSVTSQFASALGLPRPTRPLADVTTTSFAARRFYEHGMRWYYHGDVAVASRYFMAALDEDSTFGMAAFYASTAGTISDRQRGVRLSALAAENASNAPERERLLIRYLWAQMSNHPSAVAVAESLAVRYPNEPNGEMYWGSALLWSGDFAGAATHLRRAVLRDSLGLSPRAPSAVCTVCDALLVLAATHLHADSIGAAELAAREWVRIQPGAARPRLALAEVLGRSGRRREALIEAEIAARTTPLIVRDSWLDVRLALNAGDFEEVHRVLDVRSQDLDHGVRDDALWWTVITLRYQGRLTSASSALDRYCIRTRVQPTVNVPSLDCSLATGPVLFELGRYREAAQLYESLPGDKLYKHSSAAVTPLGMEARHRTWVLTHAASAYAAAGDTAKLKLLVDSVYRWGKLSGFGRDRRLHFYSRGLLAAARGQHREASVFFRRAIFSPSEGFTRINLELARALLEVGRSREAIEILRPALRGPIQSNNLYVTHTEIHEMLAKAFAAAGARDSAASHYRYVARAWRNSDSRFRSRVAVAQRGGESVR